MKKNYFFLAFVFAFSVLFFSACETEEPKTDETGTPSDTTKVTTVIVDFEDVTLAEQGYWNGSDASGKFVSNGFDFLNTFTDWGGGSTSWDGFACSNKTDKETAGSANQYSVFAGSGANASKQFAVGYPPYTSDLTFNCPKNEKGYYKIKSLMVTNSTYTYLAIKNGEGDAKKFEPGDWYKVTFVGHKGETETGKVDYYLADFSNGKTFISDTWTKVDVSTLGEVDKITILFDSSDKGQWGINTPTYLCIDDIEFYQ